MECCTLNNNDDNKDRFSIRLQQSLFVQYHHIFWFHRAEPFLKNLSPGSEESPEIVIIFLFPLLFHRLSRGTQDDASLAGIARCRWRLINPTTNKHHLSPLQGYYNNLYSTKCLFLCQYVWFCPKSTSGLNWKFEFDIKILGTWCYCYPVFSIHMNKITPNDPLAPSEIWGHPIKRRLKI